MVSEQALRWLTQLAVLFDRTPYWFSVSLLTLFSYSAFLGNIKAAFDKNPELANLLLDKFFSDAIQKCQVSD